MVLLHKWVCLKCQDKAIWKGRLSVKEKTTAESNSVPNPSSRKYAFIRHHFEIISLFEKANAVLWILYCKELCNKRLSEQHPHRDSQHSLSSLKRLHCLCWVNWHKLWVCTSCHSKGINQYINSTIRLFYCSLTGFHSLQKCVCNYILKPNLFQCHMILQKSF